MSNVQYPISNVQLKKPFGFGFEFEFEFDYGYRMMKFRAKLYETDSIFHL